MNDYYPLLRDIRLHVEGRISAEDAQRQERTAREILSRLQQRPGVILADEVGMGKTFVALAVAVSVALQNRGKRPAVVMVPSALKEKWPADFSVFREKCLPQDLASRVRSGSAETAVDFLKLLDDPADRKKAIIFLTHGALSRGLSDRWVMLAIVSQALYRRRNIDWLKRALCRGLGDLLQMKRVERKAGPDIWERLLSSRPSAWLAALQGVGYEIDDDPVPESVLDVLPNLNTDAVFEALKKIPIRRSTYYGERVIEARHAIKEEAGELWIHCLHHASLRLPLLIMDEAHHLKNADTRLASLFRSEEAQKDADEFKPRGALGGVFERMLFLTATPFQLGHGELCSVLDRFSAVRWDGANAPELGRDVFVQEQSEVRAGLDAAQEAAIALDHAWGLLKTDDLIVDGQHHAAVDTWWSLVRTAQTVTDGARDVLLCFQRAKDRLREAETRVRPWIVRHLKSRTLGERFGHLPRRDRLIGRSIHVDHNGDGHAGIAVSGDSLLSFLLAARASAQAPEARPVFAEGLASSYEAFLNTRRTNGARRKAELPIDSDDELPPDQEVTDAMSWYLDKLEKLLPKGHAKESAHPKIAGTVARVVNTWRGGEKIVVFCHYIATGRILRQTISVAIDKEIRSLGAAKLGCSVDEASQRLERIGDRFFDVDSPLRRACDDQIGRLVKEFAVLCPHAAEIVDIVRRNVRTPSFLVRYFPLDHRTLDEAAFSEALETRDSSGGTLRSLLRHFFTFLSERCGEVERQRYLDAVGAIQTGKHSGAETRAAYSEDELQGDDVALLLPNVRLVNGTTRPETRQRLMLTFNTPFYPEVLIASNVMAEGVDLHLNCRYMIHHDLCWNPSTLEQRTGRIDRIGAKTEVVGMPIQMYIPFIGETQDEKMYRVVMDRERWFGVVMGEKYTPDLRTTEKLADRIPFPESAAAELAFDLSVKANDRSPSEVEDGLQSLV